MTKLIFNLSAPMQSYVKKTSSNRQFTEHRPTVSAIVGMLAASLGYRRGDQRITDLYQKLDIYVKNVRTNELDLIDYQNVHYYKTAPKVPLVGYSGLKQVNAQVWRSYLQDAKFEIQITGEKDLLEKLQYSLKHPYFALACGRRSCPPDRPLDPVLVE